MIRLRNKPRIAALLLCAFFSTTVFGLPEGEAPKHGVVAITRTDTTLEILQKSNRAIIEWLSFSTKPGETVRFLQPSRQAIAYNKIIGTLRSELAGRLEANGRIILYNPNGITVRGAVKTAGFIATTIPLDEKQFKNESVDALVFRGNPAAEIVNLGTIDGDDFVFLIGKGITNQGTINSLMGTVGLITGSEVRIERVSATGDVTKVTPISNAMITNAGSLKAVVINVLQGNPPGKNTDVAKTSALLLGPGTKFVNAKGGKMTARDHAIVSETVENHHLIEAKPMQGIAPKITVHATNILQTDSATMTMEGKGVVDLRASNVTLRGKLVAPESTVTVADQPYQEVPKAFPVEEAEGHADTGTVPATQAPAAGASGANAAQIAGNLMVKSADVTALNLSVKGFESMQFEESSLTASTIAITNAGEVVFNGGAVSSNRGLTLSNVSRDVILNKTKVTAAQGPVTVDIAGSWKLMESSVRAAQFDVRAKNLEATLSSVILTGNANLLLAGNLDLTSTEVLAQNIQVQAGSVFLRRTPTVSLSSRHGNYINNWIEETGDASLLGAAGNMVINAVDEVEVVGSIVHAGSLTINADSFKNMVNLLPHEEWKKARPKWYKSHETRLLGSINYETPSLVGGVSSLMINAQSAAENTGLLSSDGIVEMIVAGVLRNGIGDRKVTTPVSLFKANEIDLGNQVLAATLARIHGSEVGAAVVEANGSSTPEVTSLVETFGSRVLSGKTLGFNPAHLTVLIENGVRYATGGHGLLGDKWSSAQEQRDGLIANTKALLASDSTLSLGKPLTEEQKAVLKEPVLWFELDGSNSMRAKVLLPPGSNEYQPGGEIFAKQHLHIVGDLNNTGTVISHGNATIDGNVDHYTRTASIVGVVAKRDFFGSSKSNVTYEALQAPAILKVGGNLIVNGNYRGEGVIVIVGGNAAFNGGAFSDQVQVGQAIKHLKPSWASSVLGGAPSYMIHEKLARSTFDVTGSLGINADQVNLQGTRVVAGGINMQARNGISLMPQAVHNTTKEVEVGLFGVTKTKSTQYEYYTSELVSGAGITMAVMQGDYNDSGTRYDVAGSLSIQAAGNILLNAPVYESRVSSDSWTVSTTGIGRNYSRMHAQEAVFGIISAGDVKMTAGGSFTAEAPIISSSGSIDIHTGDAMVFRGVETANWSKSGGWNVGVKLELMGVDVLHALRDPRSELNGMISSPEFESQGGGGFDEITRQMAAAAAKWRMMVDTARTASGLMEGVEDQDSDSGVNLAISLSKHKTVTEDVSLASPLLQSTEHVSLKSERESLTLGGGMIIKSQTFTADAARDFSLVNGQVSRRTQSRTSGGSVGVTLEDDGSTAGITLSASQARSSGMTVQAVSAFIEADHAYIMTGRDLAVIGSQVRASQMVLDISGNLMMRSVAETSVTKSSSMGGSITIWPTVSGSANYARANGESHMIDAIAKIGGQTGTIMVGGDVAMNASQIWFNDSLSLAARSIISEDMNESRQSQSVKASFSTKPDDIWGGGFAGGYSSGNYRAIWSSVISPGDIRLENAGVPANVQFRVENALLVTRDATRGFGLTLTPEMRKLPGSYKNDLKELKRFRRNSESVYDRVSEDIFGSAQQEERRRPALQNAEITFLSPPTLIVQSQPLEDVMPVPRTAAGSVSKSNALTANDNVGGYIQRLGSDNAPAQLIFGYEPGLTGAVTTAKPERFTGDAQGSWEQPLQNSNYQESNFFGWVAPSTFLERKAWEASSSDSWAGRNIGTTTLVLGSFVSGKAEKAVAHTAEWVADVDAEYRNNYELMGGGAKGYFVAEAQSVNRLLGVTYTIDTGKATFTELRTRGNNVLFSAVGASGFALLKNIGVVEYIQDGWIEAEESKQKGDSLAIMTAKTAGGVFGQRDLMQTLRDENATDGEVGYAIMNGSLSFSATIPLLKGVEIPSRGFGKYTTFNAGKSPLAPLQNSLDSLAEQHLLPEFRALDPALDAGYTGSFKTGTVGNPNKTTFGQPIDLNNFDIDYWIESDILFQKFGPNLKANPEFRKILSETPGFEGLKPNKEGFSIKFKPTKD